MTIHLTGNENDSPSSEVLRGRQKGGYKITLVLLIEF